MVFDDDDDDVMSCQADQGVVFNDDGDGGDVGAGLSALRVDLRSCPLLPFFHLLFSPL